MGIKHLVIDANEEVCVIFSGDDAIDKAHPDTNVAEYTSTGDQSHLVMKPGQAPTLFVIHALSAHDERRAMTRAVSSADAQESARGGSVGLTHEAYRLGCSELRNVEREGDSVSPRDLPLLGAVEREIGLHVMRISGMLDAGASREAGEDLGK